MIPILIPSYEPDERLLDLLEQLTARKMGPIIIVNDGSGPEYDYIFARAEDMLGTGKGKILVHEVNKGKGRALKTAFAHILDEYEDAIGVVTADSDGQHDPDSIKKITDQLEKTPQALVLGVRRFDGEDIPWKSRAGNTITEKVFSYISGVHVTDTQTGLRGISREYMRELLDLSGERFEFEMRMLVDAAGKIEIIEVPIVTIYDSKENHQTHFNSVKDSIRIYKILGEKLLKFCMSSAFALLIDLVLFTVLCKVTKGRYPFAYVAISTVIARVVSATVNYCINYQVVFKSQAHPAKAAVRYVILAAVQMSASACFTTLLVHSAPAVPEIVFKMITDSILFLISYAIQQRYVFRSTPLKNR